MLPKSQRLNLKKDFKFVQSGQRVETSSLRLTLKSGENQQALVGIALTKRDFKSAVERNRARRLASTAIQSLYPNLRKDLNLVIMPKSKILESKVEDLVKELENVSGLYQTN